MPEKNLPKHFLENAREIAEALRFKGDALRALNQEAASLIDLRDELNREGIKITENIMPEVHKHFSDACCRLKIPMGSVDAFVYASPEIQAFCNVGSGSECIIRFSSALITLLDGREFEFVVGHELAHFLLQHPMARQMKERSIELFRYQRAQEISADRLGLVACGSIDVASRALMKTVSGLGEKHIRFNMSEFIGQIKNLSGSTKDSALASTHPSFLMRGRALLWFSMSKVFLDQSIFAANSELDEIDKKITIDLTKDADGLVNKLILDTSKNVQFWLAGLAIVKSGSFGKIAQDRFAKHFDSASCTKLKIFLASLTPEEAIQEVQTRVNQSISELNTLIPLSIDDELAKIKKAIEHFNDT